MGKLDAAQRKWLGDLGVMVGGGPPPADRQGDGHDDPRFAPLLGAARKLGQNLQAVRDRLAEQVKVNQDQWAVAAASKAAGTIGRLVSSGAHKVAHALSDDVADEEFHAVATPDDDIFDAAENEYAGFQTVVTQGDLPAAGEALKAYAKAIDAAKARVDDFLQGVGSGAEGATTVLKGTAVVGAIAATVATGGVAAGAAVPMLGIAASGGATVLGTATAVGAGAGVYGVAQEGAGQVTERVIGTRGEIDFGQIALRGAKDAAIGFVGAFVGGVLAKQFAKMFGSYLSTAITAEELAAIGDITNKGVPLARDAFLGTGQRLVTDFLAGAGTTPLTTAIAVVADRIAGKAPPTTEEFTHLVLEEFIRGSALQLFIGALTHGSAGNRPHGETEPAPRQGAGEPAPQPEPMVSVAAKPKEAEVIAPKPAVKGKAPAKVAKVPELVELPAFATAEQRSRLDHMVELAQQGRGELKAGELSAYLKKARTPAQLDEMLSDLTGSLTDLSTGSGHAGTVERTDAVGDTAKPRTSAVSHEEALGAAMEAEGSAIPLGHERHHVALKKGPARRRAGANPPPTPPGKAPLNEEMFAMGEQVRDLLSIASVPIDSAANGIPLRGSSRDARVTNESASMHKNVHTKKSLAALLRDLQTVRGDTEATRAVLSEHGQALYEGRPARTLEMVLGTDPEVDGVDSVE
ncbi:MAG: hypothetical protein ABI520_15935 [Caldimonas sp.]